MSKRIDVGSRVAYAAAFLRSIGGDYEMASARGRVAELQPFGAVTLARIEWEKGAEMPERVNVKNLSVVGSVAFSDPSHVQR